MSKIYVSYLGTEMNPGTFFPFSCETDYYIIGSIGRPEDVSFISFHRQHLPRMIQGVDNNSYLAAFTSLM